MRRAAQSPPSTRRFIIALRLRARTMIAHHAALAPNSPLGSRPPARSSRPPRWRIRSPRRLLQSGRAPQLQIQGKPRKTGQSCLARLARFRTGTARAPVSSSLTSLAIALLRNSQARFAGPAGTIAEPPASRAPRRDGARANETLLGSYLTPDSSSNAALSRGTAPLEPGASRLRRKAAVPPTGSTRAKPRLPSVKRSPNELATARSWATSP